MGLGSAVGGVISATINGKRGIPKPDLTALFKTIKDSGEKQRDLIKLLPEQLKPLYDQYIASNKDTANALDAGTAEIGDTLLKRTEANYGPEVARATLDAVKGDIYAELPGQQNAIRQALAASGGFDRGSAGKALAAPVLQAAQKYASASANIHADQLKAKQGATQQAINTVSSLDAQTLQEKFGMSKEQAMTILTSNRSDLKDQLADLINQNTTETNQTLEVQGAQANNDFQQQLAKLARKNAETNAWVNLGVDGAESAAGFMSGINAPTGAPAGYSPNVAANQYASLGY